MTHDWNISTVSNTESAALAKFFEENDVVAFYDGDELVGFVKREEARYLLRILQRIEFARKKLVNALDDLSEEG